jgi:hypothetical protein
MRVWLWLQGKCAAVRRWILSVFGEEYLKCGSGVIDVAGGKGELAFELVNLNGVQVTVVDPRPLRLRRYARKLLFGYYHRNAALGKYNSRPQSSTASVPLHMRSYFEVSPANTLIHSEGAFVYPNMLVDADSFCHEINRAKDVTWTGKGLVHEDSDESIAKDDAGDEEDEDECDLPLGGGEEEDELCGEVVTDVEQGRRLIRGASLVVGLHPDQATEHIVEACLRNRVPFVIVPCCVYGRQFPNRRHPVTGAEVKDYGDLVEYLLAKSSAISCVEMDFEGKNILLYYMGGRTPLTSPTGRKPHICRGVATQDLWRSLSTNTKDESCCTAVSKKSNASWRQHNRSTERAKAASVSRARPEPCLELGDDLVSMFATAD